MKQYFYLTNEELKELDKIENKNYMVPVLNLLNDFLESSKLNIKISIKLAFDHAYFFIKKSEKKVDIILKERLKKGELRDIKQAKKSLAGNMFSFLIIYIFLQNKELGNISNNIFITTKKNGIKKFGRDFTIHVGNEAQKPDCDLVIYNENNQKTMILSLKTSLRERAGQTYKWKLLLEIAHSKDENLKNKYGIQHKSETMPLVCFATINFYNEINNPQQRGMFKFFDTVFIAKPDINFSFIKNMSSIIDFISEKLV